ncbi:ATP-binding cassette domain-containing protein [Lederbergia sp. NSJ-179]|uniref:ABC-F family ATP-binding cassette domain-containing protein n=1 Tax=Lederbergia sp. NSJ-179 TaxID=2931402 RepID=UPI001FD3A339|nr:ABC-F family ATP-binding cassette domain-containing protein [Lederbergia sp. NSJ-179]MCJ7842999.1 ATP-binding cassette domain-containing protein [Lederbergia sp. NSJ-179]
MSILEVNELTHSYGDKIVLRDVSFRMLKGEHIGLVGANGAGKSTLFKIITGQLLPDSGKIIWQPTAKRGNLEQHIQLTAGESLRTYLQGAFQDLFAAEQEMISLTEQMANETEEQLDKLLNKYSRLQTKLEQEDFYGIDAKIEEVAAGLGLTSLGLDTDVDNLSGGQRTKLLLAKLLLSKPDVLLLDEPTNYLDTAHIAWLENYLKDYPHAFMLISHDTAFMNAVVNVIYHLEHKQLTRYTGNYKQFTKAYELRKQQIHQQYERQQEEIQKLETYVQKNKARASTAKQAKSREKKLEKMTRIEKPSAPPQPVFSFSVSEQPVRFMLEATDLDIGYTRALFSSVHLKLERGEKVALIGHNGIGKTTTLKTLLGELPALRGSVSLGDRVKPAYFSQESRIAGKQTALEEIWSDFPDLTQKEVRTKLARCGLKTEHIFQPLASLSGGEQTKVRLCKLQLAESNLLVLDEPTNHLDTITKAALQNALRDYQGTIILVSHEPEFYQDWVTQVWDMESWT